MPTSPPSPPGETAAARPLAATPPAGKPTDAPSELRVHLGLFAAQLIFGGFHVSAKYALAHLSPLALVGIRVALAAPILAFLAWRYDRVRPRLRDLPALAGLGLLGVTFNQLLFINGLERTTATDASIVMTGMPVFAVAVGALSRVERISLPKLLGVLLAAGGALVMVYPFAGKAGDGSLLGNGLVMANTLCYASFLVFQRPVLRRLPWRTVLAGAFVFGGLGILAVSWPEIAAVEPAAVSPGAWWALLYIVLFPTVISYGLNTWAVGHSSPSLVAAYISLQPFLTGALAALTLGERPDLIDGLGLVLILGGLVLVSRATGMANGRAKGKTKGKAPPPPEEEPPA